MRRFLLRLDRFIEHTIDWNLIAPPSKPIAPMKLRVIFDSLRYHPLLGVLAVTVKALLGDGSWSSMTAAWVLGFATSILGFLVVMRSSAIYIATVMPALALLMPRRTAVRARAMLRRSSLALYSLSVLLCQQADALNRWRSASTNNVRLPTVTTSQAIQNCHLRSRLLRPPPSKLSASPWRDNSRHAAECVPQLQIQTMNIRAIAA